MLENSKKYNIKRARDISLRISKFLGKAILVFLLVFLITVVVVHLPAIQRKITRELTVYLSSKIRSRVEIKRVKFSIRGDLQIQELKVWDTANESILTAEQIELKSNVFDLIFGDLIFDAVKITGVNGKVIDGIDGLNIQYIIDAFQPKEKSVSKPGEIDLHFRTIMLEKVIMDYISTVKGVAVTANIGTFTIEGNEYSSVSNTIRAEHVYLRNTTVNLLSDKVSEFNNTSPPSKQNKLISPDFGTGIMFDIKHVEMTDNNFSFHIDQVNQTQKFDPSHVDVTNINLILSDIFIREDTLDATLQTLAAEMSEFKLSNGEASMHLDGSQFILSDLFISSGANKISATFSGSYGPTALKGDDSRFKITALSQFTPTDFSYFMDDSLMNHFRHWGTIELELDGEYAQGKGDLRKLILRTRSSLLQSKGVIQNIFDADNIGWKGIVIEASLGSEFEQTIAPWLGGVKIPSQMNLALASSGNPKTMTVNGRALTKWGNLKAGGIVSLKGKNVDVDMNVDAEEVDMGKFMALPWLGPIDCSMGVDGVIGKDQDIQIEGLIANMEILGQAVHSIKFQNSIIKTNAITSILIEDPKYRCEITSDILLNGPLVITTDANLHDFKIDSFLKLDSTISVSGNLKSEIKIDDSILQGHLGGKGLAFQHPSMQYLLDTMGIDAMVSPTFSRLNYISDHGQGKLTANFDVRNSQGVMENWSGVFLNSADRSNKTKGTRVMDFDFQLEEANPLRLMGIDVAFSSATIKGGFDEQRQAASLHVASGNFKGYGIALDTLNTGLIVSGDSVNARVTAKNLFYNSIKLGKLDFDIHALGDTAKTNLLLSNDSVQTLAFDSRIYRYDSGILIHPEKLQAFGENYSINFSSPIHVQNRNVVWDHFRVTQDDIEIDLDGDLHAFELSMKNVDLTRLNPLLSGDTVIINDGHLTGKLSYTQNQKVDLNANVDGLRLYDSEPLAVVIRAVSDKNHVPFELDLTNSSNKVNINGDYFLNNGEVDAALFVDVNDLKIFSFLVSGVLKKMDGKLKGGAKITGPVTKPGFNGYLRFLDASFTTSNPPLDFTVPDDTIQLSGSAIRLKNFTIYDLGHNPLIIDGAIITKDYKSYTYDLKLHTDQYTLLNRNDSVDSRITGLLVVGSDITLTGNEKDTKVDADVIIRGNTALTLNPSNNDIKLLNSEGIVEFIDTRLYADSVGRDQSSYFYDSLVASLPDFNLNSTISIEDSAIVRLNIDKQSGDFIEAAGAATLEVGYDRTGNVRVSGNYTITNGVYRLSFYDLVKKRFKLVPGSTVNWSGIPENGDLDLKAVHTVKSSSIGLIGDEVGDNEKSIYKRALPYDVGIIIKGTIENPVVSFSLDLPRDERINYPVLANKLDRMKQPEFQSELNKQVFGLLVLGGFLPESSGSDINQNVVATTALSNSVNSLLSGQLNRFASQYIKGVDIDVGIQSYSDYAASGGKTQTAMDFRVTKRIMDDRLSFEVGGDFNLSQDQSGANTGNKNFRGDIAIIYDLTEQGTKKLKLFNNETYDIIYQEIRNTGVSLIFIREFDRSRKRNAMDK